MLDSPVQKPPHRLGRRIDGGENAPLSAFPLSVWPHRRIHASFQPISLNAKNDFTLRKSPYFLGTEGSSGAVWLEEVLLRLRDDVSRRHRSRARAPGDLLDLLDLLVKY